MNDVKHISLLSTATLETGTLFVQKEYGDDARSIYIFSSDPLNDLSSIQLRDKEIDILRLDTETFRSQDSFNDIHRAKIVFKEK